MGVRPRPDNVRRLSGGLLLAEFPDRGASSGEQQRDGEFQVDDADPHNDAPQQRVPQRHKDRAPVLGEPLQRVPIGHRREALRQDQEGPAVKFQFRESASNADQADQPLPEGDEQLQLCAHHQQDHQPPLGHP